MSITRMAVYQDMLDKLKEQRDFDELFDYAVYMASQQIYSDRIGRAYDRAIQKCVSKHKQNKVMKQFMKEMNVVDEFYEEEKAFYEHFVDSDISDNEE